MFGRSKDVLQRLKNLENHLQNESPLLVDAVKGFRDLDKVAYRLGLLDKELSFASQVPWWPLISILGSDTKGKASFINNYLDYDAIDSSAPEDEEKFTLISYAKGNESRNLPGVALDADPRFPFYQMASKLDKVAPGNGQNIGDCLQMKTCPSKKLQGYLFINAPDSGFETKSASAGTITEHIIDLSDLILVFIDAEQEFSSGQQDVLERLLSNKTLQKNANKVVFILNKSHSETDEDNNDDITKFCQNVLSEKRQSSAKVLTLKQKNRPDDKVNEERSALERNYRGDTTELLNRIQQIYVDRIYRVLGNLHNQARNLEQQTIPKLSSLIRKWERGVIWRDIFIFCFLALAAAAVSYSQGLFETEFTKNAWLSQWLENINSNPSFAITLGIFTTVIVLALHYAMRFLSSRSIMGDLEYAADAGDNVNLKNAFSRNTRLYRSIFRPDVVGWHRFTRNRLRRVLKKADEGLQKMNDKYTRPSGSGIDE